MTKPVISVIGSFAVGMTIRSDHMPVWGETLPGTDFDMGPGGKGSNQAVGVARMGGNASFIGMIGRDKLGEIATSMYSKEGVNTDFLSFTDELPTGVGVIVLNPKGENFIVIDMAANNLMDESYIIAAEDRIKNSMMVVSVMETPLKTAMKAMEIGKKHNVITLLNPAPAAPIPVDCFQYIDLLTPNEIELRILLGLKPDDPTSTVDLARRMQSNGLGTIIVTQGSKGALIVTRDEIIEVPSAKVDVVDTTGAGDSFNSGLAVSYAEGKDIVTATKYACCCGALCCTRLGVVPGIPYREQVDELYNKTY